MQLNGTTSRQIQQFYQNKPDPAKSSQIKSDLPKFSQIQENPGVSKHIDITRFDPYVGCISLLQIDEYLSLHVDTLSRSLNHERRFPFSC